jgi:hypothetical protein
MIPNAYPSECHQKKFKSVDFYKKCKGGGHVIFCFFFLYILGNLQFGLRDLDLVLGL